MGVVHGHVLFYFLHRDLRPAGTALLRLLDHERIVNSVHLLVITVVELKFLQRATNHGLDFNFKFQVRISVKIVVTNVAIFHAELDLEAVGAFDGIVSDQLGLVTFGFVVHQRPVEIGVHHQAFEVILREKFGIFAAAEWRNLPTGLSVVGLNLRQALNDEFLAYFVLALIFLAKIGLEGALRVFGNGAQGVHGLQFFRPTVSLHILGDDIVNRLRGCGGLKGARNGKQQQKGWKRGKPGKRTRLQMRVHEHSPTQQMVVSSQMDGANSGVNHSSDEIDRTLLADFRLTSKYFG